MTFWLSLIWCVTWSRDTDFFHARNPPWESRASAQKEGDIENGVIRHHPREKKKKKTFGKSLFSPGWFVARSVAARPHWSSPRLLLRTYERSTCSKSKTHKTRQKNSLFKFFLLQLNHRDKNSKEHTIIKCLTPYLKVQLCLGFQPRGNRAFALLRSMVTQV